MRYNYFASVAKKEGYEQISAIFTETADNEKSMQNYSLNYFPVEMQRSQHRTLQE
jgi:rubrerythrin